MHFDWGASQFLTKQFLVGAVGYVYQEVGCDSGSGDRVGCFQSRVVGVGPQLGFIIPLSTTTQGYLNLKSYWEFANQNRPDGWNAWVTFVISPAEQTPSATSRRVRSMYKSLCRGTSGLPACGPVPVKTGSALVEHKISASPPKPDICALRSITPKRPPRPTSTC